MVDFSNCREELNNYKGSEKKKTLVYDNKKYLVKFPDPVREKNKNISYINNAYSEYVGSNIFSIIGFETQKTILGEYKYNGKNKIVCACEDFTNNECKLYEFENLALSTNPDKKIETEIEDIMFVLDEAKNIINLEDTKQKFWDMFIVDCLIGNTDRHNGNWGFVVNRDMQARFSPIYDCGSCLNPMYEDAQIEKFTEVEIKNLAVNCYSCLKENNKKINYISYIKQMKNVDCNNALCRIIDKVDFERIKQFISDIEIVSNVRKNFYISLIEQRYELLKNVRNKMK